MPAVQGIHINVEIDPRAIAHFTRTQIATDIYRRGLAVEARAKELVPVDTGRLRSSITTSMRQVGEVPIARVGSNVFYAPYVHMGTGLYGPRGRVIRPKRARYLVFTPRGAKRPVFARYVRGMRGTPFLTRALREVLR